MDISGVSIPVPHEVTPEPPRNAQLQSAVREPPPPEQHSNDSGSNEPGGRSPSESGLGRHIDERA